MGRLRAFIEGSFRAKVLVPVLGIMFVLLAVTAWVVNQRITHQVEIKAREALVTADDAFQYFRRFRSESLLLRVRDLPSQPFYKANFANFFVNKESESLRNGALNTLLAQQGVDVVMFSTEAGTVGIRPRDPLMSLADFETGSAAVVKLALQGEEQRDIIQVSDKVYDVACIPIFDTAGSLGGVLVLGSRISKEALEEPGHLTQSRIVLFAGDQVLVSTLSASDASARLPGLFRALSKTNGVAAVKKEVFDGEHFYCSGGRIPSASGSKLGYVLLYSYEQPLRALQTTQQILLLVNGLAILLGSIVVCLVIGRVTEPLRQLRQTAEAVGRGDFSRRVEVRSDDECGELARVFNQMTHNLKNSREQLEMTVDTLKTTQAQLIQSEKLSGIGEFIAGVAHELNNPLTSVMGFSELLSQSAPNSTQKRYLEMIHKSALRCQKIVQALLSFARRRSPERKAVCLNTLIEASVEILQYQLRTSNIEVQTDLDPDLPQAMVDPHQIQQVIVNIVNNARQAIEAHQPKGWVRIITCTRGNNVQVLIQDSGPGIPEDHLAKIFDPFFTTKEVGKGTGLGLSLVYGIIKEHGGTIVPRSKPGEGATFIIELPITQDAEPAESAREKDAKGFETSHVRNEGKGKRVLVIDDEEEILQMVREALIKRGYEVDVAPDGETGLEQFKERKYDLTLCDWKMPGLNGEEVYERLRAINPVSAERVIFITGDVINEKTRKFLEEQEKICIPKPFTLAEFRIAIKKVLAGK